MPDDTDELATLVSIAKKLDKLPTDAQRRIITYLTSRFTFSRDSQEREA